MIDKEKLREKIDSNLEATLSGIYNELGITTGDIHPLQLYKWQNHVDELTDLFIELIIQNFEYSKSCGGT